jgi:hypothetical protein
MCRLIDCSGVFCAAGYSSGRKRGKKRSAVQAICSYNFSSRTEALVVANDLCVNIIMAAKERGRVMSQENKAIVIRWFEEYWERGNVAVVDHCGNRIYGRLDCRSALRAIARGVYIIHRVFFLTEEHARTAGYRLCGVCPPVAYASWKAQQVGGKT